MSTDAGHDADEITRQAATAVRLETAELARAYSLALLTSDHPDAGAWSAALVWFANRGRGGQLSSLMHREFVDRFGVDPHAETHMRHTVGVDAAPAALCDSSITSVLTGDVSAVTCVPCRDEAFRVIAEQEAMQQQGAAESGD